MGNFIDLTGKRFGKWLVIKKHPVKKWGAIYWLAKCDCGNKAIVEGSTLRDGRSTQCRLCQCKQVPKKHGLSTHPLFKSWREMMRRCDSPKSFNYKNYGSRNIKVCDEWRNDYKAFERHMMKCGWESGKTIERINVNGNYCPENVTVATRKEQARNKRNTLYFTINNVKLPLVAWAEKTGLSYGMIYQRLRRGVGSDKLFALKIQ